MNSQKLETNKPEKSLYHFVKKTIERVFLFGDRLANNLFGSNYNPLYKSGTIAFLLLAIVTVTGFILVFFYRLTEPYESVKWIKDNHYGIGWIRSLHRYASGAALVAVVLHAFRMFAQGKSWGPRTFSWITGVLLLVFIFISGWTGYALVWDEHALVLVSSGAKMLDSLKILADPISRSFNGAIDQPPPSFFFLNLFLHIVVPLGLLFGVWVHTSRMARASWFPPKKILYGIILIYVAVSIFLPAPLGNKANMLSLPGIFPADNFFSFFIPLSFESPRFVFVSWIVVTLFILSLPLWLKPRSTKIIPAHNEEKRCLGCVQCVVDCPYEAIKMEPRKEPSSLSAEVAVVIDDLCVSCGLCAGSCGPMTIGVPDKKGSDHYALAREFVASIKKTKGDSQKLNIIIGCQNQNACLSRLQEQVEHRRLPAVVFPTECMGTLHMGVVEYLAQHFEHLYLAACPERNCSNKDAHFLLRERLEGRREPHLLGRVSADRIRLVPTGDGEEERLLGALAGKAPVVLTSKKKTIASVVLGTSFLILLALVSSLNMKLDNKNGILRLSWRLVGQFDETCRQRTQDELAKLPAHMRTASLCQKEFVDYRLVVKKNAEVFIDEKVSAGGVHADRPLYVDRDIELEPGTYEFAITFEPLVYREKHATYGLNKKIDIRSGNISLVHLNSDQRELVIKEVQ